MFRSNSSLNDNTPGKFLKLTKKCLDLMEGRKWMVPSATFTPYVYIGQGKYLINKLRDVVESAQAFLILFNKGSPSSKASLECLEVFKLLYDLANVVKHFIRSCCQHAWVQTAVCLTDVSEHITSVGFNLEIMRLTFLKRLHLSMIDAVYEAEAEIVSEKAITDRELLLKEVSALLETQKSTSPYYQLATCVDERLGVSMDLTPSQIGLPESYCVDEKCLKQMGQLGKGSFAIVHKALWLGIEVAKKTFLGRSPEFEKEVSILLRLSHPNITSLIGYAQGYRECSIIMELMDEDLHTLIQRRMVEDNGCCPPFCIYEAIDIMLQIGGGMQYLRKSRIVHRDLKSMNILVKHVKTEGSRGYVLAKVSDFGLSKTKEKSLTFNNQTLNIGTTRWMAPELIKLCIAEEQSEVSKVDTEITKYPYSSDVYSFAMVCYEILTGDIPFIEEGSLSAIKEKVSKGDRPELPDHCPLELKNLIEQCWSWDPSTRPSFFVICAELRRLKCLFLAQSRENWEENLGQLKRFTINQLRNATKNFNIRNEMWYNAGCHKAYKAMLSDGTLLAIKSDGIIENEQEFQSKVEVISMATDRHLLPLYGFCTTPSEHWLAYPYMPNESVASHLKKPKHGELALSSGMRKHIALGAAKGLAYLHERCNPRIIHRDVNPDNILLDDELEAVVGNFGCAMLVDVKHTHVTTAVLSTQGHVAPEYMLSGELSEKTDVYGYGLTLLQLITGQGFVNLSRLSEDVMLLNWVKRLVKDDKVKLMVDPFLKEYDMNDIEELLRVALLCTQNSPAARPKMSEVVSMLQGTGLEERWAKWKK